MFWPPVQSLTWTAQCRARSDQKVTTMSDFFLTAATPAEWLMLCKFLVIFAMLLIAYAWFTGEW
jgi:hypothetical protein